MIRTQLSARGVLDPRVHQAMRDVPRDLFVRAEHRDYAYADEPLRIGCDQTISQPFIVGLSLAALAVQPHERVLEVGSGSGWAAALLGRLGREVIGIERHAPLALRSQAALASVGASNVRIVVGDGSVGLPDEAPFDAILVSAAAPHVPSALLDQLAEGGRLLVPVDDPQEPGEQRLMLYTRYGDEIERTDLGAVRFVPLIGADAHPSKPDRRSMVH